MAARRVGSGGFVASGGRRDPHVVVVGAAMAVGVGALVLVDLIVVVAGYSRATADCVARSGCSGAPVASADGAVLAFGVSVLAVVLVFVSTALSVVGLAAVRRWLGVVALAGQVVGVVVVTGAS